MRVKGIGEVKAAKLSSQGLTVGGTGYKGVPATAAAAKKEDKPVAKTPEKKAEEKPVAAKEVAKDATASDCEAQALDKTGKPLAGAAKLAFVKSKAAFIKKCEAGAKASK
ncbi:hypothetical protein Rfer_2430 [Rhodoferax ferrireducens T118]|uniref:Uncharacterized protein n=1 Tax=Albidiferax ferrireducens (strain ATCC BAA-621 / DSM 15236 / T118) TaxID=338969 RepID=Q21VQ6_ALBFT|nr:hypothetical protein [Rhodoferax ferrireducens]ABD70147.1 hypothetical protein Rfer_2430 [Rhodoferax ferrireducens T118]